MNPSPHPLLPSNLPALDATCDRIVAALTRRLAEATRQIETVAPAAHHDFLVPIMHPEMTENITAVANFH